MARPFIRSASAHNIGLQNGVRRHDLVIVREVETGGAIHHPAVLLDQLHELHLPEIVRPLEHQMFKKMSKAGSPLRFDAETDVVVHGDRGGGRGGVLRKDDLEAIVELVILRRGL